MKIGHASIVAAALLAIGCSDESNPPAGADSAQAAAAKRGRQIYENVCIACHNGDPTQAGALGPPVEGASRELIEAKVLRGEYPPGYTPQRPGQTMPRYEYLAGKLGDVAVYLQQD